MFEYLIEWIYSEDDIFKIKRKHLLDLREFLTSLDSEDNIMNYKMFKNIQDYCNVHRSLGSIESLVSDLLWRITRNTGFEVTKSILGECWYKDCCNYSVLQSDDECGLLSAHKTGMEKALMIFEKSCLKEIFNNILQVTM